MKKASKYFLGFFIIFVVIIGFIIPSIFQRFYQIDPFFKNNNSYKFAAEPFQVFLLAAEQIENNGQYPNRCAEGNYKQILLQTYSWMMTRGPIIEICAFLDKDGKILDSPSYGRISGSQGIVIAMVSFLIGFFLLIKYLIGILFFRL